MTTSTNRRARLARPRAVPMAVIALVVAGLACAVAAFVIVGFVTDYLAEYPSSYSDFSKDAILVQALISAALIFGTAYVLWNEPGWARRTMGVLAVLTGLSLGKMFLDGALVLLFQPNPIIPRWPLWLSVSSHVLVFVALFLVTRDDSKDYYDQF